MIFNKSYKREARTYSCTQEGKLKTIFQGVSHVFPCCVLWVDCYA